MTWQFPHERALIANSQHVAFVKFNIEGRNFRCRQAEPLRLFVQIFEKKPVGAMGENRGVELAFPLRVVVDVVEVAVRVPDGLELGAVRDELARALEQFVGADGRINDDEIVGNGFVEQKCVCGERATILTKKEKRHKGS